MSSDAVVIVRSLGDSITSSTRIRFSVHTGESGLVKEVKTILKDGRRDAVFKEVPERSLKFNLMVSRASYL
jgi:hypothetical protein